MRINNDRSTMNVCALQMRTLPWPTRGGSTASTFSCFPCFPQSSSSRWRVALELANLHRPEQNALRTSTESHRRETSSEPEDFTPAELVPNEIRWPITNINTGQTDELRTR